MKISQWQQFNGPVPCRKRTFFFAWKLVKCGCKDNATPPGFFFFVLHGFVQVFHKGQLTVRDLFLRSVKRPGRTRLWWMMSKCFLLLIRNVDHIGAIGRKPLLKTCWYGLSGLLQVFTCVSEVLLASVSMHWLIYESGCRGKKQSKTKKTHLWPPFGPVSAAIVLKAPWDSAPHWFPLNVHRFFSGQRKPANSH